MILADLLRFAARALHLGAMSVWMGSGLFYLLARSSLRQVASLDARRDQSRTMRMLMGRSFGVIVASGVYLLFDRLTNPLLGLLYVGVLAVKLAAVAGIVWSVRSGGPRTGRQVIVPSPRWGIVWSDPGCRVLALGAAALLLGVVLTLIFEAQA